VDLRYANRMSHASQCGFGATGIPDRTTIS
jgi:hypothetical protein